MRFVLVVLVASLCGGIAVAQPDGLSDGPETPEQETEEARRSRVIARVGEVTITVGRVEDAINEQSPILRIRYREPAQVRQFVDGLIRFELLARAAERADLHTDPAIIRVLQQNAVQQLIRRDFDEQITTESVPAESVQQYYDTHPEEFTRSELRRAAHIAVSSRDEAARLIEQAREVDAAGFRELVSEHSLDPETRLRGGDLRYFDEDGRARNSSDVRVTEAIAAAAFALEEVGDVAGEPISVNDRFSVVKLTGIRAAEHRSVTQADPTIRLRLWRQLRQTAIDEFVARLRADAGVEVDYALLRPIRLDPAVREDVDEEEDTH